MRLISGWIQPGLGVLVIPTGTTATDDDDSLVFWPVADGLDVDKISGYRGVFRNQSPKSGSTDHTDRMISTLGREGDGGLNWAPPLSQIGGNGVSRRRCWK